MVLMSLFSCACGSRGPRLLPCFHLLVSTSCAVNQGWVAKVPANPYVKKSLRRKLSIPCIKKKEKKKKRHILICLFFFTDTLYFCVHLFLEICEVSIHVPMSLLHFCVMVLFVYNVRRCFNGITNVSVVTLNDSGSFSQPSLSCEKQLFLYI